MKVKWIFAALILMICSCGQTTPIPVWKDNAYRHLEDYKIHFLAGREDATEPHFVKARREIASGNDLQLLAIAYLTKYALHTASLENFETSDFAKIYKQESHPANMAYCHFLKGNFSAVDTKLLSFHYRGFMKAVFRKDAALAAVEIASMDDPLSRLVACGVWIRYMPYNEEILQAAISTAAAQGWRRPLWAYLEKLHDHYVEQNDSARAAAIRQRLELLKK